MYCCSDLAKSSGQRKIQLPSKTDRICGSAMLSSRKPRRAPPQSLAARCLYKQGATNSSQLCWSAAALAGESSSGALSGKEAACSRRSSSSQKSGVSTVSAAVATRSPRLDVRRRK